MLKAIKNRLLSSALAATMFVVSPVILASARQPMGQRGHHEGFGMGRGPGPGMEMLRELNLTDAQKEQVRTILQEARSTGVRQRLMEARKTFQDSVDNGAKEDELSELAEQIGDAERDAAMEMASIQSKIQAILTDEQRQELKKLKAEARQKMQERQKRFQEHMNQKNPGAEPLLRQ